MGPDFQYDRSKTPEENHGAKRAWYLAHSGYDIDKPDPEITKEVEAYLKEHDDEINRDLDALLTKTTEGSE